MHVLPFRRLRILCVVASVIAGLLVVASPAYAATITVNTLDGGQNADGACSLREATVAANTNAAFDACAAGQAAPVVDVITFSVTGTIGLTGELTVTDDLSIDGPGALSLTISRGVPNVNHGLFTVSAGKTLNLEGLTVANGSDAFGGGIQNSGGTLTVANSTFSGNSAFFSGGGGGGIYNVLGGTLTVTNSTFSSNSGSGSGGGILNEGTLTITSSTFSGNSASFAGGGLRNSGGTLTVTDSTFSGNSASNGGGISNTGTLSVTNSTFSGNSGDGGGIFNEFGGTLVVTDSTFSSNSAGDGNGGALFNVGTLTLTNSTLSGNSADDNRGGGMLNVVGTTTVTNVTFSGNSAIIGGGIANIVGTLTVTNSTVSGNSAFSGGGLHNLDGTLTLRNSIVASSPSGGNCAGGSIDGGGNLQHPGTDCGATITSADPMLDPAGLQDNGGPTETIALQAGSPAIDTASPPCPPPATDQRGVARPQGAACDIGAFELEVAVPATLTLGPATATNPVGTTHTVTATVEDASGNPLSGVVVRFTVTASVSASGQCTTDSNGQCSFTYQGPELPGADAITAFADTDNDGTQDAGEPPGAAAKTWILPVSTPLCTVIISDGGRITANNGDKASFGGNAKVSATGSPSGQQSYQDHGPAQPMKVKSINVLAVTCSTDRTQASVYGRAKIDGSGSQFYLIQVKDLGKGGKNDTYRILLETGYDSGEHTLEAGNITIK